MLVRVSEASACKCRFAGPIQRCTRATLSRTLSSVEGRVLLTRERGKNELLAAALQERGIATLELPLVETAPGPEADELPATLRETRFDWVALTSPEAAKVFLEGWRAADCPQVRIAVVGKGTSRILDAAPEADALRPEFIPSMANADYLSAELPRSHADFNRTMLDQPVRVLYPASVKAARTLQNGLRARGFAVTRLNTYTTLLVRNVPENVLEEAKECAVVSIASPSALRAWTSLVGLLYAQSKPIACIGSTSGSAALKLGYEQDFVFWDKRPGMEGFVRSIEAALAACSAHS